MVWRVANKSPSNSSSSGRTKSRAPLEKTWADHDKPRIKRAIARNVSDR
jgi:hypothetical protein